LAIACRTVVEVLVSAAGFLSRPGDAVSVATMRPHVRRLLVVRKLRNAAWTRQLHGNGSAERRRRPFGTAPGASRMVEGRAGNDLLTTVESTEGALEAAELFFQYYRENANYLERTYDFVERLGIEKVRKETVYAPDVARQGLLDRLQKSKSRARDAWLEGQSPRHPTQFIPLQAVEQVTT
jgi:hypothetical protein